MPAWTDKGGVIVQAGFVAGLGQFFQYGAMGVSFAFLCLSFYLLNKEQQRPKPRSNIIFTIILFAAISFVFFISGVASQVIIAEADYIVKAYLESSVRHSVIGEQFEHYKYDGARVEFQINQRMFDDKFYVPMSEKDNYKLVVSIRQRDPRSKLEGEYPIVIKDFAMGPSQLRSWPLTDEQKAKLGNAKCVDFVIFGISQGALSKLPVKEPLSPSDYGSELKLLDIAADGPEC
jgi:hypothetical protein